MMKKIAFFVEGPTEAEFLMKLLNDLMPIKKKAIKLVTLQGSYKDGSRIQIVSLQDTLSSSTQYVVHIYSCNADNSVNSDVMEISPNLFRLGFTKVVALKDLRGDVDGVPRTETDLPKIENAEEIVFSSLPIQVTSVIAVMEIETWFLGETNHYERYDSRLTTELLMKNIPTIGLNPFVDRLEDIATPAETLNGIYMLVKKNYSKKAKVRVKTINALDMTNLFVNVSQRLNSLGKLINEIDTFFV